jgi:hypothetical protein
MGLLSFIFQKSTLIVTFGLSLLAMVTCTRCRRAVGSSSLRSINLLNRQYFYSHW